MSTPLQITLIIIAVIAAIVIIAAIVAKSARQNQYLKISASYGKLRKYEFTYEEYESISHYFKNTLKEGELHIDGGIFSSQSVYDEVVRKYTYGMR